MFSVNIHRMSTIKKRKSENEEKKDKNRMQQVLQKCPKHCTSLEQVGVGYGVYKIFLSGVGGGGVVKISLDSLDLTETIVINDPMVQNTSHFSLFIIVIIHKSYWITVL